MGAWGLVLLLAILAAGARGAPVAERARSRIELELLALESAWDDAVAAKDRARLEQILDNDFVMIGADGQESDKAGMIAGIMAPELKIETFQTRDVRVRVYGNTAVLSGWFSQRGTWKGEPFEVVARYTDIYVRRGGGWRGVLAHATRLAKRPAG